jgi:pyruvate/2-oxoglutarate/acetoin dehydrogenase E1 component/TPP-dependent pyruvate/acetoin dehydrogenase alpha subunit
MTADLLCLLDAEGNLVSSEPVLDDAQLVEIYKDMVRARVFDEQCLRLQRTGRIPAYYQSSGMEASVGAAHALDDRDWVFTAYREQPIRLARGVPIVEELAIWKGAIDRAWNPVKYRITPLNATIATHITHAVGFAYGERLQGRQTVTMPVFGDGATSEGDFHAGMNFAGVWGAPVVFYLQNNQYAQSTPLHKQTASQTLAQKASAYGFPGVRVDGMDVLAVHQAVSQALDRARRGDGPTLIEAVMYRYAAHSTYDGTPVYRTREEEEEWRAKDPIQRQRAFLTAKGLLDGIDETIREEVAADMNSAVQDLESAGLPPRDLPFRHVYSRVPQHLADQLNDARGPDEDTEASAAQLFVPSVDVPLSGPTASMTMVEALNAALAHGLETNDRVVILGEDVGFEGGVFRVTEGLQAVHGESRVIDTPLNETGIMGTSVGMALSGLKPVAEMEFAGFMNPGFDQIVFHAARYRWRTRGVMTAPMVIRMPGGGGHEGYEGHSDNIESYFLHTPGLFVVYPSNPIDAKGLLASALEGDDPVVFFEPIVQYFVKCEEVPIDHFTIPIGRGKIVRQGTSVTTVSYGNAVNTSLEAADALEGEGISVELIDLRTIKPWDTELVLDSVAKTGRLVVTHEAPVIGGVGAEIIATVVEQAGYLLETPPVRVGHPDMVWGQAKLETYSLLNPSRVAAAVRSVLAD